MRKAILTLCMLFFLVWVAEAAGPSAPAVITSPSLPSSIDNFSVYLNATDADSVYVHYDYNISKNSAIINSSGDPEFIYLYQETSNASGFTNLTETGFLNENYSKPPLLTGSPLFSVRHGNIARYNITVPDQCLDAYPSIIVTRIFSNYSVGFGTKSSRPQCHNGTAWISIGTLSSAVAGGADVGSSTDPNRMIDGDYSTGVGWNNDFVVLGPTWLASTYAASMIYETGMYWESVKGYTPGHLSLMYEVPLNHSAGDVYEIKARAYDGTTYSSTTTRTITIIDPFIENCSGFSNVSIRFTIYDEDSPETLLDSEFKVNFDYRNSSGHPIGNYSYTGSSQDTYQFCISPGHAVIYSDIYAQYTSEEGFTHRYYMVNGTLSNVTQNISIFNFNTTTGISDLKITVRNKQTYQYMTNVIGTLQRYYVGESVWRSVQMDETGDYGQLFFNILEENTDYRIIFMDRDNNVLQTTQSMKFVCTSDVCSITYLLEPYSAPSYASNVSIQAFYDNISNTVNISWDDPSGRTSSIDILISKETMTGTTYICSNTTSGASGTYACDMTGYTGTVYLVVDSTTNGVSNPEYSAFFDIWSSQRLSNFIDRQEGAFWAFIFILVFASMGLASPVICILLALAGMIVVFFIGLSAAITIPAIIVGAALGILIGVKVRR
jgi:hypothetical protein